MSTTNAPIPHAPITLPDDAGFETICTHYAESPQLHGGGAVPPIYQNSTFVFPTLESYERRFEPEFRRCDYTRTGNPTTAILEAKVARLENGTWGRAFGSGMGAISAAINACVHSGSHVVCVAHCYGCTRSYLRKLERFGVQTTFVAGSDTAAFAAALRPETTLLYLECPTGGLSDVPDLAELSALARARGITTALDNSWATPYFLRPLDFGIDLVIHSATKFISGHSDVVAGIVVGRDDTLRQRVYEEAELTGATLDPFAAWLLLRGLRTLPLRMERHQASTLRVVEFLASHPAVGEVCYPGLPSHPYHAVARRQLRGFSTPFAFSLREQTRDACHGFINRLRLFGIGVSWGGHESLVIGGNFRVSDNAPPRWVVRLHIGLETVEDLIADIRQALEG
jgi:cystathionine beta-lyase/cystathionine gamma-synthase